MKRNKIGQFIKGTGEPRSEETKKKISEKLLEAHRRGAYKETKGQFKKGHIPLLETRKKISKSNKGRVCWNVGKKASLETRKKQSISAIKRGINRKRNGKIIKCLVCGKEKYKCLRELKRVKNHYCSRECAYKDFKGQHHSPKTQFKKGKTSGKNHPQWKGGITPEHNRLRGSEKGRKWCRAVAKIYDYTCQKCGVKCKWKEAIHHILNFAEYPKLRFKVNNGIVFCKECHKLFHKTFGYKNNTQEQIDEFLKETF